jgi:hypothetical protein
VAALHVQARSRILPAVNVNEIRELYSAAPFQPFEIVLTKGSRLCVDHPEFMSFSHDYRTVCVHEREGGLRRVDVKSIVALDDAKNGARTRKRKR